MKKIRLNVEVLEDRQCPAIWGNPWVMPENLTLSFAPDGTSVSGQSSTLHQELDSVVPRSIWQGEILRAFQSWAARSNINLTVVADQGAPFGSGGAIQGASSHGDIRIGAVPLSHGALAVATPFDLLGDWSGDVLFNSNYNFATGPGNGAYDLFTVALQEAGHVFGLPNSVDTSSAMFTQYLGVRSGPSSTDIANLQSLYGARVPDRFESATWNNTKATATPVRFIYDADQFRGQIPSQGSVPWVVHADLSSGNDVDFYRVRIPADLKDFWVELRTSGISLLNARVTVLNSAGRVVESAAGMSPTSGDLALFVKDAKPNGVYFVKVQRAQANAFGTGAYHLAVGKETHESLFPSTPSFINDDRPDDDAADSEPLVALEQRTGSIGPQWDYAHRASVSYQGDMDRYLVVAPSASPGTTSSLVVTVWGLDADKLDPKVSVFESGQSPRPLPVQVLRNESGVFTVQLIGATPGAAYEIRVEASDPQGSRKEGNYFVGANFLANPVRLGTFGEGVLTQETPQQAHVLQLTETRLFHFTLSADASAAAIESAVRMTIYDLHQQPVFTLVALAGETTSANVLLQPGSYVVRMAARARSSSDSMPQLTYRIMGITRNDPIGPLPVAPSPILTPTPPPLPEPVLPPDPLQSEPFTWLDLYPILPWFSLEDPFADPWKGL